MIDDPVANPNRLGEALRWWARHSYRYVLPAAGAISLTLGASLALDTNLAWDSYAPSVLMLVGVGALGSALAHLALRRTSTPDAPARIGGAPLDGRVVCPTCSTRLSGPPSTPPHPARRHSSVVDVATPPPYPTSRPPDPGDFLWASWVPQGGRLPVELVGPVAATAYSSPAPGAPSLYEEGEPILLDPPAPTTLSGLVHASGMAERTALGPTPMASTEFAAERSSGAAARFGWSDTAPLIPDGTLPGSSFTGSVHHEAMNPTPPHLRPRPRSTAPPVLRPIPRPESGVPASRCADCSEPSVRSPAWRRCVGCHRPLCGDCIVRALLTYQRGWCSGCAASNAARPPAAVSDSRGSTRSEEGVRPAVTARSPRPGEILTIQPETGATVTQAATAYALGR